MCKSNRTSAKVKVIFLLMTFLAVNTLPSRADGDNYNQWASMEYKQWSFSPDWYYYSWYDEWVDLPWPLSGFWITVPGLGIHDDGPGGVGGGDNYVNERWRQMTPLRSEAVASATLEKTPVKSIKNDWDSIHNIDMRDLADKEFNLATMVNEDSRKSVIRTLASLAGRLNLETSGRILDEYARIKENLDIIGSAFLPNSDKIVAYDKELKRLEKLKECSYVMLVLEETNKVLLPKVSGKGEYELFINLDIN